MGVLESPTALDWLRSAGVECTTLSQSDLSGELPGIRVIVLPLDRVRSEASIRSMTAFAARGGKVVAVYWGTVARPDQQGAFPVYKAASLLGIRVMGWTLTGPAVARLGLPGTVTTQANDLAEGGYARAATVTDPTASSSPELRLEQWMMVRVEAEPSAQILAWLIPSSAGAPLVLAVRNGNMFYVAANLFHRGSGSTEFRRLFFWVLDQAGPGMAYAQARERAGSAAAAVIHARLRLSATTSPLADAVRRLLDEADAAAGQAKTLATADRFAESVAASERSRGLTERAMGMLEGH
jgi:hypothetical protein